jgi:hypothetical protein
MAMPAVNMAVYVKVEVGVPEGRVRLAMAEVLETH